jgi:hypothetical protein
MPKIPYWHVKIRKMPKIHCLKKNCWWFSGSKIHCWCDVSFDFYFGRDENKKTARYYAIANINEPLPQYLGRRLSARLDKCQNYVLGWCVVLISTLEVTPSREEFETSKGIMESKTDPAPTTEIQLQYMYWDGKRHYGKKTLKSPKLLNTAWVNSVWDTRRINQSGRDCVANGWNYRQVTRPIEDIPLLVRP